MGTFLISRLEGALTAHRSKISTEIGQGLAEYALILSIIAIASIIVLAFLGGAIESALSGIGTSVGDVM